MFDLAFSLDGVCIQKLFFFGQEIVVLFKFVARFCEMNCYGNQQ